ncbi:polyphosphate kinase 2 [Arsenicitalea aurantiaca]|uniref:polyphosphate kinase 2 n=1 Tax=Arsenicitalea aurantiaca TaxID=1783274 RepID=UPI001FCE8626|nr:polyphosphate kinase 2 [Arsenicitalea aurantiaca]
MAAPETIIDSPELDPEIRSRALASGGYPYGAPYDKKVYKRELEILQIELVKLQSHLLASGERVVILFEGRDAAGKGGAIKTYREHLNPRYTMAVALPKPSDREQTQWYFQRYVDWLPAAGETVLFDRSWYNRAGVEPVMGFCTPAQTSRFLAEVPRFEEMLVHDGVHLFKFWLSIGREMQIKRFHDRRHDPLKTWKLSPIDLEAITRWDAYSEARDTMLTASDSPHAPWTVVRANDKRRARLNLIRSVLGRLDYAGKNPPLIGEIDTSIVMDARSFLALGADR